MDGERERDWRERRERKTRATLQGANAFPKLRLLNRRHRVEEAAPLDGPWGLHPSIATGWRDIQSRQ